jgi:hypothetical protein
VYDGKNGENIVSESRRQSMPALGAIELSDSSFIIDAKVLGELLNLPPVRVPINGPHV